MLTCSLKEYAYKLWNGCTEIQSDSRLNTCNIEAAKVLTGTAMKRTTVSTVSRNWLRDMKITRVTQKVTLYFDAVVINIVRLALPLNEFVEGRITF